MNKTRQPKGNTMYIGKSIKTIGAKKEKELESGLKYFITDFDETTFTVINGEGLERPYDKDFFINIEKAKETYA